MRGAIAAGHRLTAEAGAEILAEGGNAVDACLAAGFASWVAESTLTGPGGGGFMLVHRARDRTTRKGEGRRPTGRHSCRARAIGASRSDGRKTGRDLLALRHYSRATGSVSSGLS